MTLYMIRSRHAAALACLAILLVVMGGCGKRTSYQAHRTRDKITVDGKLENVWFKAKQTTCFVNMYDTGSPQKTTARLLYDDKFLYVAFECDDTYVWSTKTQRDDCIWEEEVVDVYVDPSGSGKYYREYQTNPLGTQTDLVIPQPGAEKDWRTCAKWSGGFKSGVQVLGILNDKSDSEGMWVVEMAIPWSDFQGAGVNLPPKKGDKWRLQMFRIDRPRDAELPTCCSWSPSRGKFHEPRNFGVVEWM